MFWVLLVFWALTVHGVVVLKEAHELVISALGRNPVVEGPWKSAVGAIASPVFAILWITGLLGLSPRLRAVNVYIRAQSMLEALHHLDVWERHAAREVLDAYKAEHGT